jgi:hypothetical protein
LKGEVTKPKTKKQLTITEADGKQTLKTDFTFAETVTMLEIWKVKLINGKFAEAEKKKDSK